MREKNSDPVQKFAIRNKASPNNCFSDFFDFSDKSFNQIYYNNIDSIDAVKLQFRYTTLTFSSRTKSRN